MDILIIKIIGMAFPQTCTSVNHFFPCAVEISFLHTKGCGIAPFPFKWRIFKFPFIPGGTC
jgi:hypothetical protein